MICYCDKCNGVSILVIFALQKSKNSSETTAVCNELMVCFLSRPTSAYYKANVFLSWLLRQYYSKTIIAIVPSPVLFQPFFYSFLFAISSVSDFNAWEATGCSLSRLIFPGCFRHLRSSE